MDYAEHLYGFKQCPSWRPLLPSLAKLSCTDFMRIWNLVPSTGNGCHECDHCLECGTLVQCAAKLIGLAETKSDWDGLKIEWEKGS